MVNKMDSNKVLTVPTALISCHGLEELTNLDHRLWWRLIDELQKDKVIHTTEQGIVLKILARDLMEDGENDRRRLTERLRRLSNITLEANLDGRDNNELWRVGLKLVSEYEVKSGDAYIYINVGTRFYTAVRDRQTYARIMGASLFAMKGSKYSSRLYTLIRDKINLRQNCWSTSIEGLKLLLQVKDDAYSKFADFRINVLDKAISEITELSELDISWKKSLTFKGKVLEITFDWELKDIKDARKVDRELARHAIARGKSQDDETIIIQSDLVRKAIRYLETADVWTRMAWHKRYTALGYGELKSMLMKEDRIKDWVDERIAQVMRDEDVI